MFWTILSILLLTYLLSNGRHKWIYILYKTLPRDLKAAWRFIKLNHRISTWVKNKTTVASSFARLVKQQPDKILFYYEDEKWTFLELELYSNQVANYFKSKGWKKGDSIGLLLENRPEYVGIWLGLSKIGVVTALINTNLVAEPLLHLLKVADCKALIYGQDNSTAVAGILDSISELTLYQFRGDIALDNAISFSEAIRNEPKEAPIDVAEITPKDKLMYIFTSGTTGLPKAAVISHTRYMYAAVGIYNLADLSPQDVFYNPLPLYHTAGGMLAIGLGVVFGLTVALRKKFSASNYWSDCQKYGCNVSNYIGEICRYLLAVHKPGTKVEHPVQKMIGNGLRPQIWQTFLDTFHVANIHEFYGSTEGNCNLINIDNTVGAVGFVPRLATEFYRVIIIRCDENTAEPIRNSEGFCIRCNQNEPGILVGKIIQGNARSEFTGYADAKATEKKILKNVFQEGDLYFNTGDVLVQDDFGYFYFKDRSGDTFRWKGENVATSEVEAVISNVAELKDTVVYGVQIPGSEGKAGMAAIVDPENNINIADLAAKLKAHLPSYAIPLFLRIMDSMPMTSTFKLKKRDLQNEGFDLDAVKNEHRIYFYDSKLAQYVPLSKEVYQAIIIGQIKV
ncbi:hypothetical protein ABEB36_006565 [Hypothenemus hampei]|uniref:Very long-chain fatty acid transport protein n=1 Tax=Hypothenemus hampei TaxID=57062 RepID=A0ABD1ERG8_HYPHA